jgi:hypothetical protein
LKWELEKGLFTEFPFWAESVVVQARANNE